MRYLQGFAALVGGTVVGFGLSVAAQSVAPVQVEMARAVAFGQKANGHVAVIALDEAGRVLCSASGR